MKKLVLIDETVKAQLDTLRVHPRQSYSDVIKGLIESKIKEE